MLVPTREAKYYGAVHVDNYLTYQGFCKKVGSDELCSVDVYLDGIKIDTILADQCLVRIQNIYDVEGHCFLFDLKEEYLDKSHVLEFKASQTDEVLVNSKITTISKQHPKFNEYRFLKNVEYANFSSLTYTFNSRGIGVICDEQILSNNRIMGYLRQILDTAREVHLFLYYFDEALEPKITNTFQGYEQLYTKKIPTNIDDIVNSIELFLFGNIVFQPLSYRLLEFSRKIISWNIGYEYPLIRDYDVVNSGDQLLLNCEKFGLTNNILMEYGMSYTRVLYERLAHICGEKNFFIDIENDGVEFYCFTRLQMVLNMKNFKENYIEQFQSKVFA